ncbi:tRNA lysidine(34) synthetase TilS [Sediminibacterium soli]|uniref:tRNA lysidine(34) synthetase TilS n=1 Tax=Sediminibacterium soli TaxID=2698829 RepID=UPI001379438D|nr:tRNA lysidine(34) synthetase TilS [Sediminibacterium soli]NCI46444.1 tRNA lysidine(34) synthetase TilS [Sediminibacterium soli]
MPLSTHFIRHWQQQFPQVNKADTRLLLAVSGGVDSSVLVDLVRSAGFAFSIAHMNFRLRGQESERDEIFVRTLAGSYGCEALVKQVDSAGFAEANGLSIQEAARMLRYNWFREILDAWKVQHPGLNHYLVTAHHADDAIETMLMHFFRGTGIAGMTGIPAFQKERQIIRPLLAFRKTELLAYAGEHRIAFVEDSSNAKDDYTRNFFRNQLLPQLRQVFPQVESNLLHDMERFSGVAVIYQAAIAQQLKKMVEQRNGEWHIPVLKWKKVLHLPTLTWEIIKPYGFHATQTPEVIRLLDAANGSYIQSSTHRIIRNRSWMIITTLATETAGHIPIGDTADTVRFDNGLLRIRHLSSLPAVVSADASEAFIDERDIVYPLVLRKWKQGDYFYPLGMQKKKKISRFLIDLKLSKTEKEKTWVLESDKKILWIVGRRIDNRFRLSDRTQTLLHITVTAR